MKKNRLLVLASFLCLAGQASGQLTIGQCREKAHENYPLIVQYGLIEQASGYDLNNAGKAYLPQVSVSGRATYQSDVVSLPIMVPGLEIPSLDKDNYNAAVEIGQTIWDGGAAGARKEAVRSNAQVNRQSLEVEMYAINQRVEQLFFGILLIDEQLKQNAVLAQELQRNHDQVSAYIAGGIANQADLNAVAVMQLDNTQTRIEMETRRKSYLAMLSAFVGEPIDLQTTLVRPPIDNAVNISQIHRPELALFDAQNNLIESRRKAIRAGVSPALGVFVQGGYGKPGLNFLSNNFEAYYIIGARLSWSLGGFYTKRNELLKIDSDRAIVESRRKAFLFNTNQQIIGQSNEIDKISRLMDSDEQIIALRGNIKRSAEAKVAGGTLSVTEFMREVLAESIARQNKAVHEIMLLKAIYDLKNTTNN